MLQPHDTQHLKADGPVIVRVDHVHVNHQGAQLLDGDARLDLLEHAQQLTWLQAPGPVAVILVKDVTHAGLEGGTGGGREG